MIETFKIVTLIYDTVVAQICLRRVHHMQHGVTTSDYSELGHDMIYENTISVTDSLVCRILCLVMSSLQNL